MCLSYVGKYLFRESITEIIQHEYSSKIILDNRNFLYCMSPSKINISASEMFEVSVKFEINTNQNCNQT